MSKSVTLRPRMSEKAYALSKSANVYIFEVPLDQNKHQIAEAVSTQFEVPVTDVRISVYKGKKKQSYRKRTRPVVGQRRTVKKAYVTIEEGNSIPIFAAVDEAEEKAKEAAKKQAKKAEKK